MRGLSIRGWASVIVAAALLAACGSSSPGNVGVGVGAPADGISFGQDAIAGTSTDTTAASSGDVAVTGDVAVGGGTADAVTNPCAACKPDETCIDGVCKAKSGGPPDPCDGKCTDKQECKDGKCIDKVVPCPNGCKADEYCDKVADGGKGKCVKGSCELPKQWNLIQKVSKLQIAGAGKGCDLNGDLAVDNAGASIAALANGSLGEGVKNGSLLMLLEATGLKTDGSKFDLALLAGDKVVDPKCDVTTATCQYQLDEASYDLEAKSAMCPAKVLFDDATIKAGKLKAGDGTQSISLTLPLAGVALTLKISKASILGDVVGVPGWTATKNGLVCGAMTKKSLKDAIDALPAEELAKLGGKEVVLGLLDQLLKPDIDIDGDDKPDLISIALEFETIPGEVTGVTTKP
jgi:hypothetical protein